MDSSTDSKIQKIQIALERRGFEVELSENVVNVMLDSLGIPGGMLDFYVLKKKTEHVRARLRRKLSNEDPDPEKIEDYRLHAMSDLEYVRSLIKDGLMGAAKIGKFHYYGCRNLIHYYYAHVDMTENSSEQIIKKMLAQKAISQLKDVDSKKFRKGLDFLGLPRSSILRLALNRIFRRAAEPEELLDAVTKEAVVIVGAEEWKSIREIMNGNKVPFMSSIMYIFWDEVSRNYLRRAREALHE